MRRRGKADGFQRYQRAGSPRIPSPKLGMGQKLSLVNSETEKVGLLAKVRSLVTSGRTPVRRGSGRGS